MQLYKKFSDWLTRKESLDSRKHIPSFSDGEVFWWSLGKNIGSEECGKGSEFTRPVSVLRKFNKHIFLGVPLSTKIKEENLFYTKIIIQGKEISAMIFQIRILDSKRLGKRMSEISHADYNRVMENIKNTVFKNFTPKE